MSLTLLAARGLRFLPEGMESREKKQDGSYEPSAVKSLRQELQQSWGFLV